MPAGERILGVEGGGTKTAWAVVIDGKILESGRLPPSNFRLTPFDQLTKILRVLPREVDRVGIFLAGCGTEEDRTRLIKLAREVWPKRRRSRPWRQSFSALPMTGTTPPRKLSVPAPPSSLTSPLRWRLDWNSKPQRSGSWVDCLNTGNRMWRHFVACWSRKSPRRASRSSIRPRRLGRPGWRQTGR